MTLAVSVVVAKKRLVMNENYWTLIRSVGKHIESRNNNRRDNIDIADIGIVGIGIADIGIVGIGIAGIGIVGIGIVGIVQGHTEGSVEHTEVSVEHTEGSAGHTEGSVGHTDGSVEHTEESAGHTEESAGYNIENTTDIGDRPGMFQHLLE